MLNILEKPGVPVSKPATVPSTGATSRIVHPDEDISLVSLMIIYPISLHSILNIIDYLTHPVNTGVPGENPRPFAER